MKKIYLLCLLIMQTGAGYLMAQNVGINATGALPDTKAMLDISSTSSGLLIPRMTTVQRDAIAGPTVGLQVYNLTTNTVDVFRGVNWEATGFMSPTSSVVNVNSLADLPAPSNGVITLVEGKMYSFSGIVNISPNYIDLNGAAARGNNPVGDGVASNVSGAVLRSTGKHVYLEKLLVILASSTTKAYDFADNVGDKSCNIITGNNVKPASPAQPAGPGVGTVSGFRAVIILQNYFDVSDGLKVTGTMGRLILGFNLFGSITAGNSAVEMLSGLTVNDVDLSNNHFIFTPNVAATGIKISGATVDRGRMSTNMFRNVATPITGFSGDTPGWQMQNNTGVPNTRAQGFLYMNGNTTATNFVDQTSYVKVAGNTTIVRQQKFTSITTNRLTYAGKSSTSVRVTAIIGGKAPFAGADYSIAIIKNGVTIPLPAASIGSMLNNQGFQIVLETDVDLATGDFLELGIRNTASTASVTISDLQLRVSE
ncbi:hypothetical protein GCM10011495_23190 [Hymenobacter frigidus]|uniref:Uncharacterized protein n=1 Tax=Hymenobacter frigidus TaxID=1524095 RepID=A0ABQ2A6U4_9BACT|nr:hypothetical protein [Hymenobacter frigidus]GGH86492.1 hypothetical protein GCM10011495_23190 [Hymenobacter frigidus]